MSSKQTRELTREERIQNELLQAKRTALQAVGHGVSTLEALNEQDEDIKGIEDTLEATENVVAKSMTTLRGMTWGGYLYNKCVDTKEIVFGQAPGSAAAASNMSNTTNQATNNPTSTSAASGGNSPLMSNGGREKEKDDLQEISAAVATLHHMSLEIGSQLDMQSYAIDSLSHKTEKVTEQTLAVTLKASQLRDRSRRSRAEYGGMYQFIDTVSNQFLSVIDGRLILSPVLNRATYFHCFVKESHLFAMQNDKTRNYAACAFLGHICVESTYFGTQEEVYIDFKAAKTGILFCARHWGAGGWLKRPPVPTNNTSTTNTNTTNNTTGSSASGTTQAPAVLPYLTETTSSIDDKEGWIQFTPVKVTVKEKVRDDDS